MGDGRGRPDHRAVRAGERGRFQVLHDAAERLLDELTERYVVDRREVKEAVGPQPDAEIVRTVRLVPRYPGAGPFAITFTDFPGIVLRLGRWFVEAMPDCGCDDCTEDPDELVADLRALSAAHVEGGLWERVRRGMTGSWSETRLIGPGLRASRQIPLDSREARDARREGFAAAVQWAPWPLRAPEDGDRDS
ncbi:DUF6226 family protein [Actinoplanes sp. NPDC049681]|uniref:DUF6226 family protein n=1 Tax=Actinoplanes sp. NPDC049681 TaxID=3363905 RepID=UPI00378FA20B